MILNVVENSNDKIQAMMVRPQERSADRSFLWQFIRHLRSFVSSFQLKQRIWFSTTLCQWRWLFSEASLIHTVSQLQNSILLLFK